MRKGNEFNEQAVEMLNDSNFSGSLDEVIIDLKTACEKRPHPAMVEECKLSHT